MTTHNIHVGLVEPIQELDQRLARMEPREAVAESLRQYLRDMVRWPRTVEAYLHEGFVRQDYSGLFYDGFRQFLEEFLRRVCPMLKPGTEDEHRLAVTQMWCSMLLIGMLPKGFDTFAEVALASDDGVKRFVDQILAAHFLP